MGQSRLILVLLMLAGVSPVVTPVMAYAQQSQPARPRPPAAQDEFVPVTDLPPAEQMPAGPLVLGAYGFMWAVVLAYVLLLSQRLQAVQKDIDALKRQTRN